MSLLDAAMYLYPEPKSMSDIIDDNLHFKDDEHRHCFLCMFETFLANMFEHGFTDVKIYLRDDDYKKFYDSIRDLHKAYFINVHESPFADTRLVNKHLAELFGFQSHPKLKKFLTTVKIREDAYEGMIFGNQKIQG